MGKNNRRQFLRKSILGISGAALLPGIAKGSFTQQVSLSQDLPSRVLGKTGIKTPLISLGAANSSDAGLIRAAYEAGIKLFFSATYYGEGKNEMLVGEALKGLPRDSFVIGTAVPAGGMDMRTGKFTSGFDTEAYLRKAEGSLQRFGLDYVDIFLFPYAGKRETVMNEGVLKAMEQLKKQGKTRYLGIASHSDTEEALKAAADSGIYDVAMIAYNFKAQNKDSLNSAIDYATKAGMGIVAMKTTAGAFNNKSGPALNSDAALKWALQNEHIASIVSGMSTVEQLKKNLSMIRDLKMSEQELKELNLASLEPGLYCRQCRQCIPQCPHNLDIPTIMRSYMYAYGYRNTTQAWHTLEDVDLSGKSCEACQVCNVKCASGFDVRNRILDISRLKEVPKDFIVA